MTTCTSSPEAEAVVWVPRRPGMILLGTLGVLLIITYWPMLAATGKILISSDDMAHGLFAPVVAGYIAWQKRAAVLEPQSSGSAWGFALLIVAALTGVAATLAGSSTVARSAFLVSLAGCLVLIGGFHALRAMVFPLALLLFTFPLPQVLYGEVTLPLQLLATRLSATALEGFGFTVVRDGNILELPHQQLSIVEACSGLRSLVTLGFFFLVYTYFFERKLWVRLFIVLVALPSAILLNAVRITTTGVLGEYAPQYAHGIYHSILGWVCFVLAFSLVFGIHRGIQNVFHTNSPA